MCAASVIYDMFGVMPDAWYSLERIDLFRRFVKDAKDAKEFDKESSQPDCEDPDKAKLETHINELEKELNKND